MKTFIKNQNFYKFKKDFKTKDFLFNYYLSFIKQSVVNGNSILFILSEQEDLAGVNKKFIELLKQTCHNYAFTDEWQEGSLTNFLRVGKFKKLPDLVCFFHNQTTEKDFFILKEAVLLCIPSIILRPDIFNIKNFIMLFYYIYFLINIKK